MKINQKREISPNDRWTVDEFNGMSYRPLGDSGLRVGNVGIGTLKSRLNIIEIEEILTGK